MSRLSPVFVHFPLFSQHITLLIPVLRCGTFPRSLLNPGNWWTAVSVHLLFLSRPPFIVCEGTIKKPVVLTFLREAVLWCTATGYYLRDWTQSSWRYFRGHTYYPPYGGYGFGEGPFILFMHHLIYCVCFLFRCVCSLVPVHNSYSLIFIYIRERRALWLRSASSPLVMLWRMIFEHLSHWATVPSWTVLPRLSNPEPDTCFLIASGEDSDPF